MKSGKGKPCGASHISASKVCRVSMAPEVQKALNAVAGEVGAATLKEAVKKHAGGKGVARLREIRADIRNEMGGVIVKGPKADELKKRLQAEGLLPNGKAKSVAEPDAGQIFAKQVRPKFTPLPTDIKQMLADLASKDPQVPDKKGRTTLENEDLSRIMRGEEPVNMKIVSDASAPRQKSQIAQLQSVLGLGAQTRQEVGRDLEGLVDEAVAKRNRLQFDIKGKGGEERRAMQQEIDVLQKAIDGPKTGASAGTRYARESAKNFDKQILREDLRREGDKNFDGWDATIGKGSKKLGQGAYGTVIRTEDKSYAVKRGDLSDTEATLIKKLGEADLGPKLIAADIDGPGRMSNPGVDVRNGRLAMSIVAGSPIGSKAPDKVVGGVKVADAYWTARANLHRMGIAHNDMHIDNVLVDRKGKGRFVDMGLAQESPKAALAEALGAFDPPKGGIANRVMEAGGQGDWQVRRWNGTAGRLLAAAQESEHGRRVLENRAPVAARVLSNKNAVQSRMQKDGFSKDDIASVMDHGLRSPLSTYNQGVWSRMTDYQAMRYINMLYEGV
jgi:hypothetical protein